MYVQIFCLDYLFYYHLFLGVYYRFCLQAFCVVYVLWTVSHSLWNVFAYSKWWFQRKQTFYKLNILFSSVQSLISVWLFATPWTTACQVSLSITNSRSSPKPMSIESVMPSNHLILCHPLLLLHSVFPSSRIFSKESALHIRWNVLEFQLQHQPFNISPSNEHSFKMDCLDLLGVQGTLKSLLQHHSS